MFFCKKAPHAHHTLQMKSSKCSCSKYENEKKNQDNYNSDRLATSHKLKTVYLFKYLVINVGGRMCEY